MVLVYFSYLDLLGNYRECSFGGQSLEESFEVISILVNDDWQLISVKLQKSSGNFVYLPVDAFDGESMKEPIKKLQQSWEEVLMCNSN